MIFDILSNLELYRGVLPELQAVAEAMDHDDIYSLSPGAYSTPNPRVSYTVFEYSTATENVPFTFHKRHSRVEIVLSGRELVSCSWRELCASSKTYSKDTDTGFLNAEPLCAVQAAQGRFIVFLPGEPYKSGVSDGTENQVKKVVFSIEEE